jgi:radical SAM protein with 4Fe4S-binding SPASM domain
LILQKKIVEAGLNNLTVSCDGLTQETYEKYRVGGKIDVVIKNIQAIAKEKSRRGVNYPWITVKFLIFDHNWHEIRDFKNEMLKYGANDVLFVPAGVGGFYESNTIDSNKIFSLEDLEWKKKKPHPACLELWDGITIDFDGSVFPCCMAFREEDIFVNSVNALSNSMLQIWNDEKFVKMRKFFKNGKRDIVIPNPCNNCARVFAKERSYRQ